MTPNVDLGPLPVHASIPIPLHPRMREQEHTELN